MPAHTPDTRFKSIRACLMLGVAALFFGTPAIAQEALPPSGAETVSEATGSPTPADSANRPKIDGSRGQTYEPGYFSQFAPRNALDMVRQIPGFSISGGDNSRGLGQASQNVLINGQRLSSKSSSTSDQLGRIPASNVVRIEIIEGTSLDIPGLTGQVANIVTKSSGISGQFEWEGGFRTKGSDPEYYGGEISVTGSSGSLTYTVALANNNNRFGARGPSIISDAAGTVIERRFGGDAGSFDEPTLTAALSYLIGPDVTANLNASYARTYYTKLGSELREPVGQPAITRTITDTGGSPEYELSGDITFPFGPGQLKLIGLEAYDGEFSDNVLVDTPDTGIATGSQFTRSGGAGERIGRFEYGWSMFGGEWQWSGEAAFNRLDLNSLLFSLAPDGNFTPVNFTSGTGGVKEARYETILSLSRQLAPRLALQLSAGGEISQIELTGDASSSRSFKRPKGSISFAWQPKSGVDLTVGLERKVGQLSFEDFLGRVFLDNGNANAANGQLVPDQGWDLTFELNKTLGPWGSTTLSATQRWLKDYIDLIPLEGGGEARGNIDKAKRFRVEWNSTIKLDPLGIEGAQIDIEAVLTKGSVRDPLDSILRGFSSDRDRRLDIDFRHDIPRSNWAYGAGYFYERRAPYFRVNEVGRNYEGPAFANIFIEHKDVFGLTISATAANIFGGTDNFERSVFTGPRTDNQIAFTENRRREIGPIFRFSLTGNF